MEYIYTMTINGGDVAFASTDFEKIVNLGIELQNKHWSDRIRIYRNKPDVIHSPEGRPYLNIKDAIDTNIENLHDAFDGE